MKASLPEHHSLSEYILARPELLPRNNGDPSITDIQFEALESGVARGESVLVSAPTSTGKTLIGWWTIAGAIEAGKTAVYLVSHRALAKQKFEEAQRLFLDGYLGGDRSAIVCATGDSVEDAAGRKTNAPLAATILIATYEKFLGTLSVGGPPRDLTNVCFVADEVQLVGDKHRGQNAELLLTLMRRAHWGQFVGLSAVLGEKDSVALAEWLGVRLVRNPAREKALTIECRTPTTTYSVSAGPGFEGVEQQTGTRPNQEVHRVVTELLQQQRSPVIVFCMRVDDTFEMANAWAQRLPPAPPLVLPPGLDMEGNLREALSKRTAYHNAELTEDERIFVEERIAAGHVDVVFATSTLAAGVNFPLGSAVFASWVRWNSDRRTHEPISRAEFQNMAGRVGRMGQAGDTGYAILTAAAPLEIRQARQLIDLSAEEPLGYGISPDDFGNLTLQIFAGKLCDSREDAFDLIGSTLTAARELARNRAGIDHWRDRLFSNIDRLVDTGCLVELHGKISVTTFGVVVAHSGLKPETALVFINGLKVVAPALVAMNQPGSPPGAEDDVMFVLVNAALRSPEFTVVGGKPNRTVNWRIGRDGPVANPYATRLSHVLFDQPWTSDAGAANGALQLTEWAGGKQRAQIERLVNGVRLGTIQTLARDAAWVLTGISEIIFTITSPTLADESKPVALRGGGEAVEAVRQLARTFRRLAIRLVAGLPGDVLWMTELRLQGLQPRLRREQAIALRRAGFTRPIDLMDGGEAADDRRRVALGLLQVGGFGNVIRNAARLWRQEDRQHSKTLHGRRANRLGLGPLISSLYEARGDALEVAFEQTLAGLAMPFQKLDQRNVQGRPDYIITVENFPSIVVEVKSKLNDEDTVSLNSATEVLAASELAGLRNNPCVTLCSPAVDPSVPGAIEAARRLCVVDLADFAEATLRMHEGTLTRSGFYNWLTTPGIALAEALPYPS